MGQQKSGVFEGVGGGGVHADLHLSAPERSTLAVTKEASRDSGSAGRQGQECGMHPATRGATLEEKESEWTPECWLLFIGFHTDRVETAMRPSVEFVSFCD